MHWFWNVGMWIMSWVPWWVYAIAAMGVYLAILRFLTPVLGDKPASFIATAYAVAAAAFVAMDYGGDQREAWVREQWAAANQKAAQESAQRDAAAADAKQKLETEQARKEAETDLKVQGMIDDYKRELSQRASDTRRLSADDVRRLRDIDASGSAP